MIRTIQHRTRQWWKPKAGNILALVFLAAWVNHLSLFNLIAHLPLALTTILGIGLFGHFLNDWADRAIDSAAGKPNFFENNSAAFFIAVVCGSLIVALAPWWWLPFDEWSVGLLGSELFLFVLYSFEPFRLKTKGALALIADALYAHAIPSVLAYHTFTLIGNGNVDFIVYAAIGAWQFFTGLYNVAIHQFEDYENDLKTGISTWVISAGKKMARKKTVLFFYFPQLIVFGVFTIIVSVKYFSLYFLLPVAFVFFHLQSKLKKKPISFWLQSPHHEDFQYFNLNYHSFLPYWHLIIGCVFNPVYAILLFVYSVVFNFEFFKWFFKKYLAAHINSFINFLFFRIPWLIVNYSIFYFRIIVLRESSEKARREYHSAHMEHMASLKIRLKDKSKKLDKPNIAISNINIGKYTETFVDGHIKHFQSDDFYLHVLHGGVLPTAERTRGNLLPADGWGKNFLLMKQDVFDLPVDYYQTKAVKEYLLIHNIKLVLAEFGLVGAELTAICKSLNIPLIVVFYGYDAHHTQFIEAAKTKYAEMFSYASCIIGVSNDIVGKLKWLGADEHKLFYLPCAVDLNLFSYSDHSKNPPVFLSVGRFAETKSPHLTVLAFNEVLKKIPNARLRMIGKDGGGELFEACHILVKALKIEDKVDFLGILPPEKVYEEMKNARVFVQHSVTTPLNGDKEGTPVAVMEAMASGLPVVATRHAGIAELIESGNNGVLVEEYDYLAMAEKMVAVCLSDELVFEIGKNAAESIRKNELIVRNKEILIDLVKEYIKK